MQHMGRGLSEQDLQACPPWGLGLLPYTGRGCQVNQ